MAAFQQEKPPAQLTIRKTTSRDTQHLVSTNAGLQGALDNLEEYAGRGNAANPITRCGGRIFRTPVFRIGHNQLAKANIKEQESRIVEALTKWIGTQPSTNEWSVWISQHIFADLNLAVGEDVIDYNSIQVFFIGENLPAFVLVLYGVTELSESSTTEQDEETAALEFSVELARDLTTELHKYCCVDFLLLPCALHYTKFIQDVQTLQNNIESEQKESKWYYKGSQEIDTAGYKEVKEAASLVAGVSYVPYIIESREPKESEDKLFQEYGPWLLELNPKWRRALSLLTEVLGSTEDATLTCSEDKYSTVEMIVLEAARRWAFSHHVVLRVPTHSDLNLVETKNDLKRLTGKRKHTSNMMQIKTMDGSDVPALECRRYRGKSETEHLQKKAEVPTSQGCQHEAIAIVLDVGPTMNSAPAGEATPLQTAIQAITMILQRKVFAESKDEIALILFGTTDTDNPLVDGDRYEHVSIARHLGVADFDLLQMVQNDIQPGDTPADFIDAMIVAMDHLKSGIQGKRGFGLKRLIVLSDLSSPFEDDQLETFIDVNRKFNVAVYFIRGFRMERVSSKKEIFLEENTGPDLDNNDDDAEGEDQAEGGSGDATPGKDKTPQQRDGEAMAKNIIEKINGMSYSFNGALPALSYFQSREVRPTAWKCLLEVGPNFKIPINGYIKMKEFKLKQSWKNVYAKNPSLEIKRERTYHMDDEEETEVDPDDIVEGYRYGSDRVPITAEKKECMKYQSEKCFKVLGFTQAKHVKRGHHMGDSCLSVSAEKGDEAAAVALSALIHALYETNCVAIVRRVYAARTSPRIGCLKPHIKADYECFYWIELPFAEDIRPYTFGSLPLKEGATTNKKYTPSADQLKAVDELITSMDLSTASENEDGEKCEALKPKLTFNPYFQRVYQCLQHRALHPDEELPELSPPLIARCLQRSQAVEVACQASVEKLGKAFKLERVANIKG